MAMSADKRSKFAAPHRQWWRLHMSEKFSIGTKTPQKTNRNIQAWILNPETLKIRNQPHKHTRLLAYEKGLETNHFLTIIKFPIPLLFISSVNIVRFQH